MVRLLHNKKEIIIRALIDSAAQRSYLTESAAKAIGYESVGEESIQHNLFGGVQSALKVHKKYQIRLGSLKSDYTCTFAILNEKRICGNIPRVQNGPWMDEIRKMKIPLSDLGKDCPEVDLLIGADVAGKLKTGRVIKLKSGLVAEETLLGWTLMGKITGSNYDNSSSSTCVTTMLLKDSAISDLWKLDALGITDPAESKTKEELHEAALDHFNKTVTRDDEGRYEICLPWIQGHPELLSNRALAEKRLVSSTKKLESQGMFQDYDAIFKNWEKEKIIEEVPSDEINNNGHYLPHRAVYKENSATMKIRPVFDASAKKVMLVATAVGSKGNAIFPSHQRKENSPSLNDCLESGPNLLELIPSILSRFRLNEIGVISDIEKAFLQIGVRAQDREYLRFLWWENNEQNKMKIFRHRRVVFGVTSSPFLLGAVLQNVLEKVPPQYENTAKKLKQSFYVDNCVTSFNTEDEAMKFKNQAVSVLSEAKFNLRDWISNSRVFLNENQEYPENKIPVLGLLWDLKDDTFSCDVSKLAEYENGIVTKRKILSAAHRGFDPIGFTVPVMLYPKLLLQECWDLKVGWDEELPQEISTNFITWIKQLPKLKDLKIPRWYGGKDENETWTLHIFVDASKKAYAACVYLRIEKSNGEVIVQLVQARARVSPKKINTDVTITRLELLSCLIGSRLAQSAKSYLMLDEIDCYFWTDSMDCVYWIKNDEMWATFVYNRVREIRLLTKSENWRHVPGKMNPADLPSRGCNTRQLIESLWWEGPAWLKESEEHWPQSNPPVNEDIISGERRKTVISSLDLKKETGTTEWMTKYSGNYRKILRVVSYLLRFINNARISAADRKIGELSVSELEGAENRIVRLIQSESLNIKDENLKALQVFKDEDGIMRVKSKIVMRNDFNAFKTPAVLPSGHLLVKLIIQNKHEEYAHAGVQTMMSVLREKFWLIKARRTIRKVVTSSGVCRRHKVKSFQTKPAPLPAGRINDAAIFQVTGVDLAGPLYLKGKTKCWIVLYTCAVYRAVHLELITSLSTEAFLLSLRRFIARRGRPSVVYSDNGTNFVGAFNAMNKLDWKKIATEASVKQIQWIFNPPSAAWWGGFWERLVGLLKTLLRRVLGRASLHYEELATIICDCEYVVNSRPLTYISEDIEDLMPLTPLMFLQEVKESGVPDLDQIDAAGLNKRHRHLQKLRETLRERFRLEYLGQLVHREKSKGETRAIKTGDIVYIGSDNIKRMNWPLGRVLELFPGKDKEIRVVRLKTSTGEVLRPVQRLFPLEISSEECKSVLKPEMTITRSGRKVKPPERYQAGDK